MSDAFTEVPFTLVLVDLDAGVRMLGRLSGQAPAIGARVELVLPRGDEVAPSFALAPSEA